MSARVELSVVIPALFESENLRLLLPDLRSCLDGLEIVWEVLVIDGGSDDGTDEVVQRCDMICVTEPVPGYGLAVLRGFREAKGEYVLTMDADLSHPTMFIQHMWDARNSASLVIASRYVAGGGAEQHWFRAVLSRILNGLFQKGFSLPYGDLSSGFRLYETQVVQALSPMHTNFVMLIELVLLLQRAGHTIIEIPFFYEPRRSGASKARILRFGKDYLRLFFHMGALRRLK